MIVVYEQNYDLIENLEIISDDQFEEYKIYFCKKKRKELKDDIIEAMFDKYSFSVKMVRHGWISFEYQVIDKENLFKEAV